MPTEIQTWASGLSIVSPQAALAKPLSDLVDAFIVAAAGNSTHTARSYRQAVASFVMWLDSERGHYAPTEFRPFVDRVEDGRKIDWTFNAPSAVLRLVDQSALDTWRASLDLAPGSAATRVFAVRTFLRVALRDGILTVEQATNMGLRPYTSRIKRDNKPVGRRLSREEARSLRKAVDTSTRKGKRDLAALDAMLFGALRREEVVSLNPAMFYTDGGRRWLLLSGKGSKRRKVKIHDVWHKTLDTWLDAAEITWSDDGPLFVSVNKGDQMRGGRIDTNVIERVLDEYATLAGIGNVDPHDLRRTAARNAYDNGAGLLEIQVWLGHSDPKTTAHYIGIGDESDGRAVDFVKY